MFYAYVALLCSSNYIEVFFILLPQQFHIYCWTTSFEKNKMIQAVIQANYLNWHEIHLGDLEINNIWFYLCNYPVTVRSSLKILVRLPWMHAFHCWSTFICQFEAVVNKKLIAMSNSFSMYDVTSRQWWSWLSTIPFSGMRSYLHYIHSNYSPHLCHYQNISFVVPSSLHQLYIYLSNLQGNLS